MKKIFLAFILAAIAVGYYGCQDCSKCKQTPCPPEGKLILDSASLISYADSLLIHRKISTDTSTKLLSLKPGECPLNRFFPLSSVRPKIVVTKPSATSGISEVAIALVRVSDGAKICKCILSETTAKAVEFKIARVDSFCFRSGVPITGLSERVVNIFSSTAAEWNSDRLGFVHNDFLSSGGNTHKFIGSEDYRDGVYQWIYHMSQSQPAVFTLSDSKTKLHVWGSAAKLGNGEYAKAVIDSNNELP